MGQLFTGRCTTSLLAVLIALVSANASADESESFLTIADRYGLKVMPILFDSCFGVAPSLESQHMWVANPGPDRMGEEHFPDMDRLSGCSKRPAEFLRGERAAAFSAVEELLKRAADILSQREQ